MKYKILILLMGSLALFSSCLNNGDDTIVLPDYEPNPEVTNNNQLISSSNWGKITADNGSELLVPKLSVPKNEHGEDANVFFSFETSDTHPVQLPSGMIPIGKYTKVEPFNFTFNIPLVLDLPLKGATDIEKIFVYRLDENKGWVMVPISGIGCGGTSITVNINDLGYYVLVRNTTDYILDDYRMGGIRFIHPASGEKYFYSLTILEATNKYDNQAKATVKTLSRTIQLSDGGPSARTYLANLPQGTYLIQLSRERRNSLSSDMSRIEYYSRNFRITVAGRVTIPANHKLTPSEWSGWSDLDINGADGSWIEGRPIAWGEVTKTYGKGKFQATLTWTNGALATDYDLHLYGPNSFHVYFANKGTASDALNLDRDWTTTSGNAIENIYSIKDALPTGDYVVKVQLYSGATDKNFNVRIIQNNTVAKSIRSFISTQRGEQEIYRFTVK